MLKLHIKPGLHKILGQDKKGVKLQLKVYGRDGRAKSVGERHLGFQVDSL